MTIHTDISIGDYHASPCVNHSKLQVFRSLGALGYYGRYISRNAPPAESTSAMRMGNVFEGFLAGVVPEVCPDDLPDARGKVAPRSPDSVVAKRWMEEHPGAITSGTLARFERMRDAVMANATARALIEAAQMQVTVRADYPGIPDGIQSRPDYLVRDPFMGDADINLKTCDSLSQFMRSARIHGYATQAGLARHCAVGNGLAPAYYLLAVEVQYPSRAVLYRLSTDTLDRGETWCTQQLDRLAEHYEADHWPPTESDVEDLTLPVYGLEDESEAV